MIAAFLGISLVDNVQDNVHLRVLSRSYLRIVDMPMDSVHWNVPRTGLSIGGF